MQPDPTSQASAHPEPASAEKPRYKYLYSELKPMPDVEIDENISIDDSGAEDEIRIMRAWTDG